MAGFTATIEMYGDRQLSRRFTAVSAALDDARPAFHEMVDLLVDWERRQFDSQGSYASGGWTPNAPSTTAAKAALGYDTRILHRTGRLRQSLAVRGGAGQEIQIHPQWMVFRSTVPYGRIHQDGAGGLPVRKPFELRKADRAELMRPLQKLVVESWHNGGRTL